MNLDVEMATEMVKLAEENKQLEEQLAIREKALKQVIKNMYHLDKEYFIGTPPTEEEYCKNNFKYWLEQAKESKK